MKLTKEDYQAIIDSRVVDLDNILDVYVNHVSLCSQSISIATLKKLISCAESLIEAHEAYEEAEEGNQIEDYKINMCEGLDEALSIRNEQKMKLHELGESVGDRSITRLYETSPIGIDVEELWTAYEAGDYEGHGYAVYRDSNGDWHHDDLGHCSCYGPFDEGWNGIKYTKEQVIEILEREVNADHSDSHLAKKLLEEIK